MVRNNKNKQAGDLVLCLAACLRLGSFIPSAWYSMVIVEHSQNLVNLEGGPEGTRTLIFLSTSQTLSQLSYGPTIAIISSPNSGLTVNFAGARVFCREKMTKQISGKKLSITRSAFYSSLKEVSQRIAKPKPSPKSSKT